MGAQYTWGSPGYSRAIFKAQISDPAELAAVVAGTMKSWEPSYVEEFDWSELGITQFGCPKGCSSPGVAAYSAHHGLSTIPDVTARQIMIMAGTARSAIGNENNAVYVFDVAH